MREQGRRLDQERRLRRAAVTAANRQPPEPQAELAAEEPEDDSAPGTRMEQQTLWVDLQVRRAIERGEFDGLPGAGKPIPGLGGTHDPDWWVKSLIEREQVTGVLPPALALRKEHAGLDARLDREASEREVHRIVTEFNERVVEARRQLLGGPPVVTPTRDPDEEVAAWRARRTERQEAMRRQRERLNADSPAPERTGRRRPRWWPHRDRRS